MDDRSLEKKKKNLITKILILANLVMLIIGIITIPPNLQRKEKKLESASTNEVDSTFIEEELPAINDEEENSSDISNIEDNPLHEVVQSIDYSTEVRPNLGDFLWYTEDVFYEGLPSDISIIENFQYTTKGWKGLIIYDLDNEYGSNAMEFLNVNIEGSKDNLSLTLDWYLMFIAGEGSSFDETDMEDGVFTGKWQDNGLWASGPGTIHINQFYELNNKQYAIGTMDTPDGIPAFVALVRP